MQTDILILGGGPAGIQSSRTIKLNNPDLSVTMVRQERASMIYCAIPYALEGLFDKEKVLKKDSLVTDVGVHLIRENANSLDLKNKILTTEEGSEIQFKKILIVTGSTNFIPPVPGHNLNGILTLKTEADMMRIFEHLDNGAQRAIVIGAGAIGLEQALAYLNRGLEVHVVDLADSVLSNLTDADMSEESKTILENKGIKLHLGSALKKILGKEDVSGVELENGDIIELKPGKDFVLISVGMKPSMELADSQLKTTKDGFVVNSKMETSMPDVYAAGDCVQGWSGIDGKSLGGKLATNAVPMAKVAAMNILGHNMEYPGFYNGSATVVGDLRIGGTGFTEDCAKSRGFQTITSHGQTLSRFPMMPDATKVTVKLVADSKTGQIIGGQVVGYEAVAEKIDIITLAIQQKMTAYELSQLSYSAQPWQSFFPAKNAIVEAAMNLMAK